MSKFRVFPNRGDVDAFLRGFKRGAVASTSFSLSTLELPPVHQVKIRRFSEHPLTVSDAMRRDWTAVSMSITEAVKSYERERGWGSVAEIKRAGRAPSERGAASINSSAVNRGAEKRPAGIGTSQIQRDRLQHKV